jgi:hypothetical protein
MKFTFKSEHELGTTVEINFDEEHLDEIEEMFKQFLRGSGFYIKDEEEILLDTAYNPWPEIPVPCNQHPDAPHGYDRDRSLNEDREVCECESWNPPMSTKEENSDMSEKCVQENDIKPWIGLSDEEVATYSNMFNGIRLVKGIEALLKERNT